MKGIKRLTAFLLAIILTFSCFTVFTVADSEGSDESESATADIERKNNSKLFTMLMTALRSKSFAEMAASSESLKPIWWHARCIARSGEYDKNYEGMSENLAALYSENYAFHSINEYFAKEYDDNLVFLYSRLFAEELLYAEKLEACAYIISYANEYDDLLTQKDNTSSIVSYCRNYIELLSNDEIYEATVESIVSRFAATLTVCENADNKALCASFPELTRLLLCAKALLEKNELSEMETPYRQLYARYNSISSAKDAIIMIEGILEKKSDSADELYFLLAGINSRIVYLPDRDSEVSAALEGYGAACEAYNARYVSRNAEAGIANSIAGSIPVSYGMIPSRTVEN